MEKTFYPRTSSNPEENIISNLLPQTGEEGIDLDLLKKSEVVDGTRIQGVGQVNGHSYKWRLIIESGVRSVAQVPDRFFDIEGRSYPIDWNSKVSVFNGEAPTYSNFKDAIIYKIAKSNSGVAAKPYIIFDAWMDNHGNEGQDEATLSLQRYLSEYWPNESTEGTLVRADAEIDGANVAHNVPFSEYGAVTIPITEGDYLAIVVDNDDTYHAYIGKETTNGTSINTSADSKVEWYSPEKAVNVNQFKGLDMWLRFKGINAMTYFILTKYEQDILSIIPSFRSQPPQQNVTKYYVVVDVEGTKIDGYMLIGDNVKDSIRRDEPVPSENKNTEDIKNYVEWSTPQFTSGTIYEVIKTEPYDLTPGGKVDEGTTIIEEYDRNTKQMNKSEGKLWAYVNPRTMQPYDDDYWFHQNEPYYVKSLTIAPQGKQIKANQITITADQWPGMYMVVGETYIKDAETGDNQRMQIKFPLCKVKSDQTLTLSADGDPTTFNLNLEVARPRGGAMMEITAYEVASKMIRGENGCYYAIDGSTEVLSE